MGSGEDPCRPPALFGKFTLNLLMAIFFIVACISSAVLTHQNYNTEPSQDWMLVGGLTSNSATFRVRNKHENGNSSDALFVVSREPLENENTTGIVYQQELVMSDNSEVLVYSITVDSLESNTEYYYGTLSTSNDISDEAVETIRQGRFQTAPPPGERTNFKFVTAGCAMTGSEHRVFSEIQNEKALFFMHLGDFHYLDLDEDDVSLRIQGIDQVLGSAAQANLFANTALSVMWDDHDWLGNNKLGYDAPGRAAALESYRIGFPYHDPLPSNNSMYHAFTIGTVRFVISDLRSERTADAMYSDEQRAWLFNEIAQADQYDFVNLGHYRTLDW